MHSTCMLQLTIIMNMHIKQRRLVCHHFTHRIYIDTHTYIHTYTVTHTHVSPSQCIGLTNGVRSGGICIRAKESDSQHRQRHRHAMLRVHQHRGSVPHEWSQQCQRGKFSSSMAVSTRSLRGRSKVNRLRMRGSINARCALIRFVALEELVPRTVCAGGDGWKIGLILSLKNGRELVREHIKF